MIDEAMHSIFSDNVAKYFININLKNLANGFFYLLGGLHVNRYQNAQHSTHTATSFKQKRTN